MKTLERAEDADEIRTRLRSLAAEDRRQWGSMTPGEMMCHLRDAYEVALGRRVAATITDRAPIPRAVLKRVALRAPMKWPHGLPTIAEVNPRVSGSRPAEFAEDLHALLERFEEFVRFEGQWPEHPILGPMTQMDWKRWGYLHPDHHLRQFGR